MNNLVKVFKKNYFIKYNYLKIYKKIEKNKFKKNFLFFFEYLKKLEKSLFLKVKLKGLLQKIKYKKFSIVLKIDNFFYLKFNLKYNYNNDFNNFENKL